MMSLQEYGQNFSIEVSIARSGETRTLVSDDVAYCSGSGSPVENRGV